MSKITIVAHRGANKTAPENTIAASIPCISAGIGFVEIDVRKSKDHVFYLIHDKTVDRTTNGSGYLSEMESWEIDRLDAGSWFDKQFQNEKVPRLDDYLKWIKGKIGVFLDIKDTTIRGVHLNKLIGMIRHFGMEKNCFFWFEDIEQAAEFCQLAPDLTLKLNVDSVKELRLPAIKDKAGIVETSLENYTHDYHQACRSLELKGMILELGNNNDRFSQILETGADMINLDYLNDFLAFLSK